MTVSVIIPVYNGELYLEEALKSVANQTFSDFEVIVVDDASTDSTRSVISKCRDWFVDFKILRLEQNVGLASARNEGIKVSQGEYLFFLDADDCLFPQTLEILNNLRKKFDAEVCCSKFTRGKTFKSKFYSDQNLNCEVFDYREAMKLALYQKIILTSICGKLIKREFIEREGGFRSGSWYEDLDAFYRFFQYSKRIVYADVPLYFYRDTPGSFINTWTSRRLDALDASDRLAAFFAEKYPELNDAAADRRFSAHYNMLVLMMRNGVKDKDSYSRCFRVIKEGRARALKDRNVRLKNKIGALASFGGPGFIRLLSKL